MKKHINLFLLINIPIFVPLIKNNFMKNWWRFSGKYLIRNFTRGIKNLIKWFNVIWRDRDYDHSFIYTILAFKLRNQAGYIGGRDIHTRAKIDARNMNICANLIDKLNSEYYYMEYSDYEESKIVWDEVDQSDDDFPQEWKTDKELMELNIIDISETLDDYFRKYGRIYKYVMNTTDKLPVSTETKRGIAINIAHINHKRAKKLLFKIMEENIDGWWD